MPGSGEISDEMKERGLRSPWDPSGVTFGVSTPSREQSVMTPSHAWVVSNAGLTARRRRLRWSRLGGRWGPGITKGC